MTEDLSTAGPTSEAFGDSPDELALPGREMLFGYEALSALLPAERRAASTTPNGEDRANDPDSRSWVVQLRHRSGGWLERLAGTKPRSAA